ncbi:MAG: recombinase family protein [Thermoplasmata archaeon]
MMEGSSVSYGARCDRCWSVEDVGDFELARGGSDAAETDVFKAALCRSCRASAPHDPLLFRELFLRFASKKEFLQHFDTVDEVQAIASWCEEVGLKADEAFRLYSVELRELGLLTNLEDGFLPSSCRAPYGYSQGTSGLKPLLDEAIVVTSIFKMYNRGMTLQTIAQALNNQQIPTKTGAKWHRSTVRYILRNPLYIGYARRKGSLRPSKGPPLIDLHLFERVQKLLTRRCRRPGDKASPMVIEGK